MEAFRVDRELVTIPTEHASFPDRCLACGGPAEKTAPLKRTFGLDLMTTAFYRFVELHVPVCNACWLRKKAAYLLALSPFVISLTRLIAVSDANGDTVSPPGSPFDVWMKATVLTGVLAYYTVRRFSEWAGLGLRITKMSSGGALVTLRCKSTRDALEIAQRTREAAEQARPAVAAVAPFAPVQAPARTAPRGVLARYRLSPRRALRTLIFLLGVIVAVEVVRAAFCIDARPLSVVSGVGVAFMLPLLFSRRIMLTIVEHGFVYAGWGQRLVRWSEIEWATLLDPERAFPGAPAFPVIEIQPKDPEAFRARLSRSGWLHHGWAALARPQFAIDLGLLDADANEVFAHFHRNVPAR